MSAPANITPQHWRDLTALGFSVFPVKPGGKEPMGKWKDHHTNAPDPGEVAYWVDIQANIGIACGAVSGLVVLDLDTPEAVAEAQRLGIPDTITAHTGRGFHVYFRHPGGKIGNRAGIMPGADIRGDGGYVVAPPSLHPSGARYRWSNPPDLFELADMPAWLVDMLAAPKAKAGAQEPSSLQLEPSRAIACHGGDHPYCLKALEGECAAIRNAPNGQQEATLNRAALKLGHYVGGGVLTYQTAKNGLLSAALAMPAYDPRRPWTQAELIKKIERGLADGMAEPKGVPDRGSAADFDSFDPQTGEIGEAPALKRSSGFRFVQACDLAYRPPEFLIDGLIETDSLGLFFGDPGCGKSFLAVDLGLSVASGTAFHGRKVKTGPVFYIAGEGHNGFSRRFQAWSRKRGVPLAGVPLFVSTRAAQFLDGESARPLPRPSTSLQPSMARLP
jgi:hypothetical protein